MKRPAAVAVVLLTLASLTACAGHQRLFKPPHEKGKQEIVVLHLRHDASTGGCKLYDRTPPEIRTEMGGQITWLVAGNCSDTARVSIDPTFRRANGSQVRIVEPGDLDTDVPAGNNQRLTARVRKDLTKDEQKGLYFYQVRINGDPAEFNARADDGEFYMCPKWPCGDFEDF